MVVQEKFEEDCRIVYYRALLVAHGFRQEPGIDFTDTYLLTILYAVICIVLSNTTAENKEITGLDIETGFLESQINKELYLKLPKQFLISRDGKVELEVHNPEGTAKKPDTKVVVKLKRS